MTINYSPTDPTAGASRGDATTEVQRWVDYADTIAAVDSRITAIEPDSGAYAPAGSAATYAARAQRTSNVVVNSTSWVNLDTTLDITLTAAAGDFVEVGLVGYWNSEAVYGALNAVSVVGGLVVNGWAEDAAEAASGQGVRSWLGVSSAEAQVGGSVCRFLTAGDIENGQVLLRIRAKTLTAANKTLAAAAPQPLVVWARNHG